MANSKPVQIQFQQYGLFLQIVASTQIATYEATDNNSYPGYAIVSGSGQYHVGGVPYTFQIAPQAVTPFNVLWASPTGGSGGSRLGIDQYGITILGDAGVLGWEGPANRRQFFIQEGAIPSGALLTLGSFKNWPPSA